MRAHRVDGHHELVADERPAAAFEQQGGHVRLALGEAEPVLQVDGLVQEDRLGRGPRGGRGLRVLGRSAAWGVAAVEHPVRVESRGHGHEHHERHERDRQGDDALHVERLHGEQAAEAAEEDARALAKRIAAEQIHRAAALASKVLACADPASELNAEHAEEVDGIGQDAQIDVAVVDDDGHVAQHEQRQAPPVRQRHVQVA